MMNRREFVKKGSLVTLAASLPLAAKANVVENEQKVFERVFQPIEFPKGAAPEFPLDFIRQGGKRIYSSYIRVLNRTDRLVGSDYILVPTPFDNKNKAKDCDYGATLLSAGLDRNILAYDSSCDGNYVSSRLQDILSMTIRHNYGRKTTNKLTDIFIHKSSFVENPSDKIKVHRVDTETWDKVLSNFKEVPEITKYNKHLNNKTNLVIGVSTVTQEFVKPIMSNGNYGIAVLENRNIILGAY